MLSRLPTEFGFNLRGLNGDRFCDPTVLPRQVRTRVRTTARLIVAGITTRALTRLSFAAQHAHGRLGQANSVPRIRDSGPMVKCSSPATASASSRSRGG